MASCSVSLPVVEDVGIPERTLIRKGAAKKFRSLSDLMLTAGSYYLPKEDEDIPLGQDAHFICEEEQTIGIADGVGGYLARGIDSGVYARELMDNAYEFVDGYLRNRVDPMSALEAAYESSGSGGGSTACIITLKDNALHAVNLGDSGFMVIRGEKTVYKSPVQQVKFNCPFQLGVLTGFTPGDADEIVVEVEPGDVVVAATDGLFDNVFDDEIEEIVKTSLEDGMPPEVAAANLGQEARRISLVSDCVTPFSTEAAKYGFERKGGKYDDVTVIVGCIF